MNESFCRPVRNNGKSWTVSRKAATIVHKKFKRNENGHRYRQTQSDSEAKDESK